MSQVFELADLATPAALESAVTIVVDAIARGETVVLPLESAYVFACDAFSTSAVKHIHQLRGDPAGTSAQVLIGSAKTLSGITQSLTHDVEALIAKFWPGLLTLHVQPHLGLAWDLGDGGSLDEFAVRIPRQEFTEKVLAKSGPLAVASASSHGQPPARSLDGVMAMPGEIAVYVDYGQLEEGALSTVVAHRSYGEGAGLEVIRFGAISLEEMAEVIPALMNEKAGSGE